MSILKRDPKNAVLSKPPAKTNETIAVNLINILRDGPEVSFIGSPIVSPIIAALCSSLPFPLDSPLPLIYSPLPIYFLQLSHAPPVFDIEIAIYTPETKTPGKRPAIRTGWNKIPKNRGVKMTKIPGNIISLKDAYVDTFIQLS